MTELSGEPSTGEEEAQGHTDVGSDEHVSSSFGEDERQGQEDGVTCLVGGEAVEVGKGDRI